MIVILELQFDGWKHEDCNTAMVNLIKASTMESVRLIAESSHVQALRKIGLAPDIPVIHTNVYSPLYYGRMFYVSFWKRKLMEIITDLNLTSYDTMIFLSSPRVIVCAMAEIQKEKLIHAIYIEHANLEHVFTPVGEEDELEASSINNGFFPGFVRFITFSPFANKRLKGVLTDDVLNNMFFLDHPVFNHPNRNRILNLKTILVYGQCVNKNFKKLLHKMIATNLLQEWKVIVLNTRSINHLDYSYEFPLRDIELHVSCNGFSKEEQEYYFRQAAWILLPYDFSMYRVSASGIFADAISYGIPIIAEESPIITYYHKEEAPLGIVRSDEDCLVMALKKFDIRSDNYLKYVNNVMKINEKMSDNNGIKMKRILAWEH